MRRAAALLLPALLALAACGGGDNPDQSAAVSSAATSTSTSAEPTGDDAQQALSDLCTTYCEQLQAALDTDCPEPQTNVSLCVDYLTDLITAVSEIDREVSGLPYSARDQANLLDATRAALDASEEFSGDQCYVVTDVAAEGSLCGFQALTLRTTATTVGLALESSTRA